MSVPTNGRTNVAFNSAVEAEIIPPQPLPRGSNLKYTDILAIAAAHKQEGFGENAIVVRRNPASIWPGMVHQEWGIVLSVREYAGMAAYAPLTVCWARTGLSEPKWMDELWLIHPSVTRKDLELVLNEQGV